jgi:hypothetical protein
MPDIKKITHLYIWDTFYDLKYKGSATPILTTVSALLYTMVIGHIVAGILLSYLNKDLYYTFTKEDGYIEYFTAVWLLATSILSLYKAKLATLLVPKIFFYLVTSVFFFGFGEEISWGQRIIGFETPADLEKINAQKEFNLHNIHLDGVNMNKIIFGQLLYTGVFIYFLALPLAFSYLSWFKRLISKIQLPIPTVTQSILYTLSFISILIINEGEKWELQEFALASFVFFSFLFAHNNSHISGR